MNGSAITRSVWMSSFSMMVLGVLLGRKGVGAVKEVVMYVGNVLTVMMGGCCNAQNALSLCIVAMLCITLRYDHLSVLNNILTFFLKKWNGFFFHKSSLHNSGLHIQFEHGGAKCISPTPGPITFTVVDVSGIHKVAIDFCNCRTNCQRTLHRYSYMLTNSISTPH